jgi:hypothetical protein
MVGGRIALTAAAALLLLPAGAEGAFPGENGRIAYTNGSYEISTVNPDGTGIQNLTSTPGDNIWPAYSSDGQRIAFASTRDGNYEIYVMNTDGSGQQRITADPRADYSPSWSPNGSRIAFGRDGDIWSMRSDGTDQVNLTSTPAFESSPAWSPGGLTIAFEWDGGIDTIKADGSNRTTIFDGLEPAWSPDGREIWESYQWTDSAAEESYSYMAWANLETFAGGNYFAPYGHVAQPAVSPDNTQFAYAPDAYGTYLGIMTRAGADRTLPVAGRDPDWQPLPVDTPSSFARPRGATPIYAPLVPAYRQCTAPNRTHGSPLAYGSCWPPGRTSDNLTLGTPDVNGKPANSLGFLQLVVHAGAPGGPDNSDVMITFSVTSVYNASDFTDYTGELEARTRLQVTDKQSGVASTGVDFRLSFAVPCTPTADTNTGANCSLSTTADSIRPGIVPEGQRTIWGIDEVKVYDGGSDRDADTTRDNQLFETQGVFVP